MTWEYSQRPSNMRHFCLFRSDWEKAKMLFKKAKMTWEYSQRPSIWGIFAFFQVIEKKKKCFLYWQNWLERTPKGHPCQFEAFFPFPKCLRKSKNALQIGKNDLRVLPKAIQANLRHFCLFPSDWEKAKMLFKLAKMTWSNAQRPSMPIWGIFAFSQVIPYFVPSIFKKYQRCVCILSYIINVVRGQNF